jgi:hypothetical protein
VLVEPPPDIRRGIIVDALHAKPNHAAAPAPAEATSSCTATAKAKDCCTFKIHDALRILRTAGRCGRLVGARSPL